MLETSKSEQNIGQKSCAEEQGEHEDKKSLGGRKQKDDSTGSATLGGWVAQTTMTQFFFQLQLSTPISLLLLCI